LQSIVTIEEYNVKCALLRAACPPLDPHVLLFQTGWEIQGYLTLVPGQPFILTKATRNGQRGFDWKVERKPIEPVTQPQSASNQQDSRPITQLESALKTAIHAAKEAEHYGSVIGYTPCGSRKKVSNPWRSRCSSI
jgi:hypothetical protein